MKFLKSYKIFEKQIPFTDILKDETQQGLIVNSHTLNGAETVKFVLYDFDDDKILGYFDMKAARSDEFYEVFNIFAQKDYGPDMYDLAMMYAYPKGVKPDTILKPGASKVWKYYSDNRKDIIKKKISADDASYVDRYQEVLNGPDKTDPDTLELINTMFVLKPTDDYDKLIAAGDKYMKKYGVDKKKLFDRGRKEFLAIYYKEE